ncbi:MAG TPA: ATP-binding protein [Verrucomicrobiae bacterium]|jgi:signal transduction histidine kinase
MFKANFRTKVLLPVIVVMALLVTFTFLVVNQRITSQFIVEAQKNLQTANTDFRNSQKINQNQLQLRFRNLPNEPLYRSLFLVGHDSPTLERTFRDFTNEPGVDVVFYATSSTNIIATAQRDPTISAAAFQTTAGQTVAKALQGEESADTIGVGAHIYDIVSIPVIVDNGVIGVLTIGSEIGKADAETFRQLSYAEIAFLADGKVVASTFSVTNANANMQCLSLFQTLPGENQYFSADPKPVSIDGSHYFGVAGRFESSTDNQSLGYVLLSPYEDSLRASHETQQALLLASLCAILFGAAVVWFIVNRVTQPLRELRDSAEAVGRGDFSHQVPVRSRDEIGELAGAFNQMTKNVRQSRAQLEQTVTTLKSTQEQLIQSEKLSAVGEFVAGVAHELNNPLAAVMGFSEMLREADVDAKYRRQLDLIFKAAQRCQKIVQSLLSFARRHQSERKPVSANELIEAVLEIVAYPLRTSNVEVITHLQPGLPAVLADGHQIQQVLLNIINNARQAIEGHQRGGQIKITAEVAGHNIRITIQDNGPGISEENLRRIFDPFFTTKEVGKGTGLGLSLCYGIIKEHGGSITPMSKPGEGATFVIELPIAQDAKIPEENSKLSAPAKTDPREGAGLKVLVVDDEEPILQMVYQILTSSGYHVHTVANGETALQELGKNYYDAIFCDWKMPGLNGREVYERVRGTNPELCRRIIFITGDVINESMREFLEKEKRQCLAKPFTLTEVRTAVKTALATGSP